MSGVQQRNNTYKFNGAKVKSVAGVNIGTLMPTTWSGRGVGCSCRTIPGSSVVSLTLVYLRFNP